MNTKLLYVYAMAKTLYENMGDYIDTFCAFVLKVLPEDKTTIDLQKIQKKIQDIFGLFIPEFSLKSVITRAKKKGYLTATGWRVSINEKGEKYLDNLEPESDVNRRINELLDDVKIYLNEPRLMSEEVYRIVLCFVNDNIEPLLDFFDPSGKCRLGTARVKSLKYEGKLIEYFKIADKKSPNFYKTLQDIVYGSIISLSALSPNIAEINKKFENVQLFLDSNVIFSLFDLHYPEADKPVKELFELLKKYKFNLKVFDFTITEIVHVLNSYTNEQHMYLPGIRVNSIYSTMKSKGWSNEDVKEFIQGIENKIWDLGIAIEPTNIYLDRYTPRKELIDKLKKYKPMQIYQSEQIYGHDLAVIDKIKEIRKTPKRDLEKSVAIFLTSDIKLSRFNFIEMKHKDDVTIAEIIPDRLLTNILWLKNPAMIRDVPIQSIIAMHSRGVFIDKKIWKRFYVNLRKLNDEKRINDIDIAMLFYNGHIEEVLIEFEDTEIEKITLNLILDEVTNAREKIDSETQKKLEDQKIFFEDKIAGEIQKQKEWEDKFDEVKYRIEKASKKKATTLTNIEIGFLIIIMIMIIVLLYPVVSLFAAGFGILGFIGFGLDMRRIRTKSITNKFNTIYKEKLKELIE